MNNIKEARKAKKISQKKLAELMGTTQQAISLYENGKREPLNSTYHKLAKILDCDIVYLKGIYYSQEELLSIVSNSYVSGFGNFLQEYVNEYADLIIAPNPSQLFKYAELINLDDNVKKYWLTVFDFLFEVKYKKTSNKIEVELNMIAILADKVINLEQTSKINLCFRDVRLPLRRYLEKADIITSFGTKKQILEFNNRLVDIINRFSKSLDNLPDNPKSDSKRFNQIENYIKRLK